MALPEVRSVRLDRAEGTALVRLDGTTEDVPRRLAASVRGEGAALDPRAVPRPDDHPGPSITVVRRGSVLAVECAAEPEPEPVRFGLANTTLGVATLGELAVPALAPVSAVLLVGTSVSTFRDAAGQLRRGEAGLPVLYTAIVAATLASGQFVASAVMGWMFKYWQKVARDDLARERRQLVEACGPSLSLAPLAAGDVVPVAAGEVVPADGRVVQGTGIVDERGLAWGEGVSGRKPGDRVQAGGRVLSGRVEVAVERAGSSTRAATVGRVLEAAILPALARQHAETPDDSFARKAVGPTLATAGVGLLVGDLATASAILRPDYATGPGLAGPFGVLRDLGAALHRGLLVRDPDALRRAPEVGLVVLDDHPALRRHGLELAMIKTPLPGTDDLLRYAAGATRHLADDRAAALDAACRERGLTRLRLDAEDVVEGITVRHGRRRVRAFDLAPNGDVAVPLGVEIDGTLAGTIRFRRARRPEAAAAVSRLRDMARAPVVLLSDQPEDTAGTLARALGVDRHAAGLTTADKARFLDDCRSRGLRTAWVGDARDAVELAGSCHVAVASAGEAATDLESCPAAVLLLAQRLGPLADLWAIAREHADRLRAAERMTLGPNLICVAGAFTFGFTSLTSVLISNLGTLGVYARAAGSLRDARGADRAPSDTTGAVGSPAPYVPGGNRVAAPV
jgi:cation transport ATPase